MARSPTLTGSVLVATVATLAILSGLAGVLLTGPSPATGAIGGTLPAAPGLHTGSAQLDRLASSPAGATSPPAAQPARPGAAFASPAAVSTPLVVRPATAVDAQTVGPLPAVSSPYRTTPAPMGVSDLGLGSTGAYAYETTSFEGTFELNSFSAFSPANSSIASAEAPNWVSLQLNAVAVNVSSLAGKPAGTFWVQNGVRFNGTDLLFEDNVWNFSSSALMLPPSSLYGQIGSIHSSRAGDYYAGVTATLGVTLPFTVQLFTNITSTTGGHTVVHVAYYLHEGAGSVSETYDTVTFNGSAPSSPSEFLVDGFTENPIGSLYDAELVLGGDGGGSNANLLDLAGSATLDRWNATGTDYESIPSAYDFGADSSETVLGVAASYTGTTVHLTQGPSFLEGLWNTVSSGVAPSFGPGWIQVQLTVSPSYAFAFATNATLAAGPLTDADYSFAPTTRAGALTADLPTPPTGDPYVFSAWADGYATASVRVGNNSTAITPALLTLTKSASTIDAPVYLLGTSQAQAFGTARATGTGYDGHSSTLWQNASVDALAAPFLRLNFADAPTFQLFASESVNLTVKLNSFVQAPTSFTYTTSQGTGATFVGWTQGYFFYGGHGRFTVANVTIAGVPPSTSLSSPPATVELYHVAGATVENVSVTNAGIGVNVLDSTTVRAVDLQATNGGIALSATGSSGITVQLSNASGRNSDGFVSKVVSLNNTTTVLLGHIKVADYAVAVASTQGTGLTVNNVTVSSNAIGFDANRTDTGKVTNLTVGGVAVANAGSWTFSSHLAFGDVSVDNGFGLDLTNDTTVSVDGGTAIGLGSAVVAQFNDSSGGTFSHLVANEGAAAANLQSCSDVTLASFFAGNGSVGAFVNHSSDVSGSGFTSYHLSVGLYVNATPGGSYTDFTTSFASVGAFVQNSTGLTITDVTATNATLGDGLAFTNQSTAEAYPMAGVALLNDSRITISQVSATEYPYAVWTNHTAHLTISGVTSWYGYSAVSANWTNDSAIRQVFAYGNYEAEYIDNCTETNLTTSTLEASTFVGMYLSNGAHDTIDYNNFVANNASGISGPFRLVHDQAYANGSSASILATDVFVDNYWSDRGAGSAYTINLNASVKDRSPLSAFYATYLEFSEQGLPTAGQWSVALSQVVYTANVSLFYVPGWVLTPGSLPFFVVSVSGLAAHPAAGFANWTGADLVEPIVFGAPGSSSAGPSLSSLYLYAAIGAVVAVVAVVAVLALRRKPPATPPSRGGGSSPSGPSPPPPPGGREWSPDELS